MFLENQIEQFGNHIHLQKLKQANPRSSSQIKSTVNYSVNPHNNSSNLRVNQTVTKKKNPKHKTKTTTLFRGTISAAMHGKRSPLVG